MNILFFLLLLILCVAVIFIVVGCNTFVSPHCCSCMRAFFRIVKNKLMYYSVIRGLLEAYFLMSIAAVYQVRNTSWDKEGSTLNFTLGVLVLIYLVAFPILSLRYLLTNRHKLETPAIQRKYGSLYENVDPTRPAALRFTTYFCVRRLVFALLICLLSDQLTV